MLLHLQLYHNEAGRVKQSRNRMIFKPRFLFVVCKFVLISTLPGALGAQEAWEVLAPSERFLGFRLKTLKRFHSIDSYKVRKQIGCHIR